MKQRKCIIKDNGIFNNKKFPKAFCKKRNIDDVNYINKNASRRFFTEPVRN